MLRSRQTAEPASEAEQSGVALHVLKDLPMDAHPNGARTVLNFFPKSPF